MYFTLQRIITAYCALNQDVGYFQGMTDIGLTIMYVTQNEEKAFNLFYNIIELVRPLLPPTADDFLSRLAVIVEALHRPLHAFVMHTFENYFVVYGSLKLLFKRDFSFNDCLRIWDARTAA